MSALQKGFKIIEVVASEGGDGLPFSRIVEKTKIPKATAHRLLNELVEMSALILDPATRCYRGGLLLARIGASVISSYDLRKVARPFLQALHDELGHVATLGIRDDNNGVYIDKIESKDFGLRLHSEIGKTFPLHCTAMGKVMLGHAEPSVVRRLLNRKLESYTSNTITNAKQLREELRQVRENGYAIDNEEITRGLVCVAAPIFGVNDEVAGAISCTSPCHVIDDEGFDSRIESVCRFSKLASSGAHF